MDDNAESTLVASEVQERFSNYRKRLSSHTIRSQNIVFDRFVDFLIESGNCSNCGLANNRDILRDLIAANPTTWGSFNSTVIKAYVNWLELRGYSVSSINLSIVVIKKYLKIAFQSGIIPKAEWKLISNIKNISEKDAIELDEKRVNQNIPVKIGKKRPLSRLVLTKQQVEQLKSFPIDTYGGRRAKLIMCLLLDQGLRAEEIGLLRTENIDIRAGTMYIERPGTEKQQYKLTHDTIQAITEVLNHGDAEIPGPLITRIRRDGHSTKSRLIGRSCNYLVGEIGKSIGIDLNMSICHYYWRKTKAQFSPPLLIPVQQYRPRKSRNKMEKSIILNSGSMERTFYIRLWNDNLAEGKSIFVGPFISKGSAKAVIDEAIKSGKNVVLDKDYKGDDKTVIHVEIQAKFKAQRTGLRSERYLKNPNNTLFEKFPDLIDFENLVINRHNDDSNRGRPRKERPKLNINNGVSNNVITQDKEEFQSSIDDAVILVKHSKIIAWLDKQGVRGEIITNLTNPEDVKGKTIVCYKSLSNDVVFLASKVGFITVPNCNDNEIASLNLEKLEELKAFLDWYKIERILG
jgi:integrase